MCQLFHSDSCSSLLPLTYADRCMRTWFSLSCCVSMIRKLHCLLVRGTAGPSRWQSSWHHIHEYVLHTAWPLDSKCEMVQRESSFGSHSCPPAAGRLWVWEEPSEWTWGWLQEMPTLTFSCSQGLGRSRHAGICCSSGTPSLEAALVALYSYCALPEVSVLL